MNRHKLHAPSLGTKANRNDVACANAKGYRDIIAETQALIQKNGINYGIGMAAPLDVRNLEEHT
ncbi:MAG TPA: hypothetical protein VLU95_08625 [Candidatus Acidoferrum sp.]|nr:hypothetical protein [Candidatus Acidoferrum sp.]